MYAINPNLRSPPPRLPRYSHAVHTAHQTAAEKQRQIYVVYDSRDGRTYGADEDTVVSEYLDAEVYASVSPDGRVAYNPYFAGPIL